MSDRIGRQSQYDAFAEDSESHARDGFCKAHDDRPASGRLENAEEYAKLQREPRGFLAIRAVPRP